MAHLVADVQGEHQPVASHGLAVLVGVGPGGLDVQGAGEGLAMCCLDTRASAPGKGDIDATTKSCPHKRVPGTHIHHMEVQAMKKPNMCCSQTAPPPPPPIRHGQWKKTANLGCGDAVCRAAVPGLRAVR